LKYRGVAVDRLNSLFLFRCRGETEECSDNFDISEESIRLVISVLKTAATDENLEIRGKAIDSLCLIDKIQGAPVLMDALEGFIRIVLDENYQGEKDPWDYDWFQHSLHHAIAILENKSFCDPLARLFESKCWDVKIEAATTLLSLGDNRAIGLLDDALNHEDWNVWANAACILFAHGDNRMWDMLVKALAENVEDHTFMKQGIINTLAKSCDPRTIGVFCDILNNTGAYHLDDMDIGRIITCLGELGDPRAITPIKKWQYKELVNCDDDVVEKALNSLE